MKNIMKRAWEIFRTLVGDRVAKLSQALKMAWAEVKAQNVEVEIWENGKIVSFDVDGKQVAVFYKMRKTFAISNKAFTEDFLKTKLNAYNEKKNEVKTSRPELATDRQISYLKALIRKTGLEYLKFGVFDFYTLTKLDCSRMINDLL